MAGDHVRDCISLMRMAGVQRMPVLSGHEVVGILSLTADVDSSDEMTRRKSAANWFANGAQRGSPQASINLVQHFLFNGVRRSDDDLGRALRRLEQLTRNGDAHAAFLLGLVYETGGGFEVNPREALAIYRLGPADDLYAAKGIARLGLQPGSRIDLGKITPLLAAAAAKGDGESYYYLAYLHQQGRGVQQDTARAQQMLQRAIDLGFAPAVEAEQAGGMAPYQVPRRKFMAHPAWATAFPVPN